MRLQRSLLLLALLALLGCRTYPACESQIAMMRAEFIALEDKYVLLESKYNAAVGQDFATVEPCDEYIRSEESAPNSTGQAPTGPSDLEIRIDPNDASLSRPFQASPIGADQGPDPKLSTVTFQAPTRIAQQPAEHSDEPAESFQVQPEPAIKSNRDSLEWRPDR